MSVSPASSTHLADAHTVQQCSMTDPLWHELLERVRRDTPQLLDDFFAELAEHEGYAHGRGRVPESDLTGTAEQVFDLFLRRLSTTEYTAADSALPDALGRRRARQGLRVDQFTEAVRINFRVLWRALHRAAQPDLTGVLMDNGERVLDVVERYATEVQRSFLNEAEEMARSRRTARERALTKLFSGHADEDEVSAIATVLGMRHDGEFELIALPTNVVTDELGQSFSALEAHSYEDEQMTYQFRHRRKLFNLVDELPELAGGYISKIDGLEKVPRAAALAKHLGELHPGRPAVTLKEGFAALARTAVDSRISGFEHELLGDFATPVGENRTERLNRLATTIAAYLEHGSVQEAADSLFVHRNTVFKRLQSFHEITGLDVTVPRDAAIALILTQDD